jgi:hypothetical protein
MIHGFLLDCFLAHSDNNYPDAFLLVLHMLTLTTLMITLTLTHTHAQHTNTHVCTHIHTHSHTHTHTHALTLTFTHALTCTHTHTHNRHTHKCTHARTHTHVRTLILTLALTVTHRHTTLALTLAFILTPLTLLTLTDALLTLLPITLTHTCTQTNAHTHMRCTYAWVICDYRLEHSLLGVSLPCSHFNSALRSDIFLESEQVFISSSFRSISSAFS